MKTEEILFEAMEIIDEVCTKFGYSTNDQSGNDNLKSVLIKAIPAMLKDSNKEEREIFYQMLRHTPIVITENLTQEGYESLLKKYIGKDINQHIIEENADLGEYGKGLGAGAYVSEPIFDKNMNLLGKKSYIYIQKVSGKAKDFYGTDINVSHLIHELGHAWHAEKEQYTMQKDGTLRERIGFAEFIYSFSKTPDDRVIKKCEKINGLMIEESMNTVAEEDAIANYMGISLEEMKEEYKNSLIPSNYQGYMAEFLRYMYKKFGKSDLETFRLTGNDEGIKRLNSLMEKTEYWKNRETDILPSEDKPRSYDKKRAIIDRVDSQKVQEFFSKYKSVYFPDISQLSPIEKIDNVLEQNYNMNMIRYNMGLENYKDFLERLGYEGYSLVNQAAEMKEMGSSSKSLITMNDAVKSALQKSTTTSDKVNEAITVENPQENTREGEITNA